jgi:hypothetical protein
VDVHSEQTEEVRDVLGRIYGAVAAIVRGDRLGVDLMLADVHASSDDIAELLAAISYATLDRLAAALEPGGVLSPHETRAMASALLTEARQYSVSEAASIHAAAQRLDAVRRHDRDQVLLGIERARSMATDLEVLWGATALLTATVSEWARRSGQSPRRAAADLCLAVSVMPTS